VKDMVETGNLNAIDTCSTGWFVGYGDWLKASLLRYVPKDAPVYDASVKWGVFQDGYYDDQNGVSEGVTVVILVSDGALRISFSDTKDGPTTRTVWLRKHGDFVAWGEGVFHRSYVPDLGACVAMAIRWRRSKKCD